MLLRNLRSWIGKGQVGYGLHGDEVDMGMWDFEACDHDANAETGHFLAEDAGYALGKYMEMCEVVILHIKYVIDFYLGDDQSMSKDDRAYIEESKATVIFSNLVAGNFSGDDL